MATHIPVDTRLLLDIAEVCQRLSVSRSAVYRLLYAGELPSVTIGARRLVPTSALEAFVADRTCNRMENPLED